MDDIEKAIELLNKAYGGRDKYFVLALYDHTLPDPNDELLTKDTILVTNTDPAWATTALRALGLDADEDPNPTIKKFVKGYKSSR